MSGSAARKAAGRVRVSGLARRRCAFLRTKLSNILLSAQDVQSFSPQTLAMQDRRVLKGIDSTQEARIAASELELRLAAVECTHGVGALRPCNRKTLYPQHGGVWHCDICGAEDDEVVGIVFHCHTCDDYDLCAPCMRTRGGGGRWGHLQADESLASRVLNQGTRNSAHMSRTPAPKLSAFGVKV